MLTEHAYIEIAAILVGGGCAAMVLRTGSVRGIGPQIRLTLAVCLIVPMIVILGLERRFLMARTIAAIVGALVGAGIPTKGGGSNSGEKPK
jgi:hypothetical protein